MNTIEILWLKFAMMVIPNVKTDTVQYREMRKAFFCGVWSMFQVVGAIGEPDVTQEQAVGVLEMIKHECVSFQSNMEHADKN